jgi:DNA-binding protein WhiA
MSFAEELKEELSQIRIKKKCCRRAMLSGLLVCAQADEQNGITVRYHSEAVAELVCSLVHAQFGKTAVCSYYGVSGHVYWDVSFSSSAALALMQARSFEGSGEKDAPCESCAASFLRGLFLAVGTVNNPHKGFHLEFLLPDEDYASRVTDFFSDLGYTPRQIKRPKGIGIYFKDSGAIEDLIALMGAHNMIFEIINTRIEREIRNNENRATNCVAKNIEKTISAATKQMEAIDALYESGKMARLPEALQQTAALRYQHPDATLDELVAMHSPLISKSGLNHRLQRLLAEAEDL